MVLDTSDFNSIQIFINEMKLKYNKIYCLINNAGNFELIFDLHSIPIIYI
jgi:NADP-dependent 3-hydroxy acid dehydrogenase YdfG